MSDQAKIDAVTPRGGKRKGAGRKPQYGEETVSRGFRIPKSLAAEIRKRADRDGVTASQIVIEALRRAFRRK